MSVTPGVLAVGCVTPLGEDVLAVAEAIRRGDSGFEPALEGFPDPKVAKVRGPDLGPWLKRKKDIRLLSRACQLALPAAGRAMRGFTGDPEELGLYVAVGREPPDADDAAEAIVAMERDGVLDLERLATRGRELYPPLLPLRTLPNMILAHVSIQHGIRGENGTYTGGWSAGAQALIAGLRAVREGRVQYALVGGAHSNTDPFSAGDRWRVAAAERARGETGPEARDPEFAPGEASIFALIGPGGVPIRPDAEDERAFLTACGDCGPVVGLAPLLHAALILAQASSGGAEPSSWYHPTPLRSDRGQP